MIKCPHCGSTAQPKQRGKATVSENGRYFCEFYECGCGCKFEEVYEIKETGDKKDYRRSFKMLIY